MDVFQITTSVFCLMTALVKLVLFRIQTNIKKTKKTKTKNQKTNEQLKERQKQRQGKV